MAAGRAVDGGHALKHRARWWRDTALAIAGVILIVLAIWLSLQLPLPWH
jgi:hypothetical protein